MVLSLAFIYPAFGSNFQFRYWIHVYVFFILFYNDFNIEKQHMWSILVTQLVDYMNFYLVGEIQFPTLYIFPSPIYLSPSRM